jgi:hypothetical protein
MYKRRSQDGYEKGISKCCKEIWNYGRLDKIGFPGSDLQSTVDVLEYKAILRGLHARGFGCIRSMSLTASFQILGILNTSTNLSVTYYVQKSMQKR